MFCPLPRTLVLATVAALGAATNTTSGHALQKLAQALIPVRDAPDLPRREALLRVEGVDPPGESHVNEASEGRSGDDELSAVISSTGIKYMKHKRPGHHRQAYGGHTESERITVLGHDSDLQSSRRPVAPRALVEVMIPNISQVGNSSATAPHKTPNDAYFGVGTGTFLLALVLLAITMKKFNYLSEPDGEQSTGMTEANPQGEEEQPQRRLSARLSNASVNPMHPGNFVPFRLQQVLVSWIFIVASIAYFLDFLALQAHFNKARHYFGVVASLLWLAGFLLHLHWQFSVGSSFMQYIASAFKVMACVMGQVHPFSRIMGSKETDAWVWWPALAGIALWHIGNVIGFVDFNYNHDEDPWHIDPDGSHMDHGNLPRTEMCIDAAATALLVTAAVCTTQWMGRPENQLVSAGNPLEVFGEFGGALLFLVASVIKCEWCNGFRNCSHAQQAD